jgi:hypothetical protein
MYVPVVSRSVLRCDDGSRGVAETSLLDDRSRAHDAAGQIVCRTVTVHIDHKRVLADLERELRLLLAGGSGVGNRIGAAGDIGVGLGK